MEFCNVFRYMADNSTKSIPGGQIRGFVSNSTRFWICNLSFLQDSLLLIGVLIFFISLLFRRAKSPTKIPLFKSFSLWLEKAAENSLASYIFDKSSGKVAFYLYAIFAFVFGYQVLIIGSFIISLLENRHDNLWLFTLVRQVLFFCNGNTLMITFLITVIGAKEDLVVHARVPFEDQGLQEEERKLLVRSTFKRSFIIAIIAYSSPIILRLPTLIVSLMTEIHVLGSPAYPMANALLLFYTMVRLTFLRYEKSTLMQQSEKMKLKSRMYVLSRFLEECNPEKMIQSLPNDELPTHRGILSKLDRSLSSRVSILSTKLELSDAETFVPVPQNTGEIVLVAKLLLLVSLLTVSSSVGLIVSNFAQSVGENIFFWGFLVTYFIFLFVTPFVSILLFNSKVIFGANGKYYPLP